MNLNHLRTLGYHFQPQNSAQRAKPITDVWDNMGLDRFLRPHVQEKRRAVRAFMEKNIDKINEHVNATTFPFELIPKVRELGIGGYEIKGYNGAGFSTFETGSVIFELAKSDASMATFVTVHNSIGCSVVNLLGSEEQKQKLLPQACNFEKIMAFGLTEKDNGSDASGLQTTATKVEGGYLLNGNKRWIGNATFADYIIIWAKNLSDKNKVQAFVAQKGAKGLSTKKIENKYSLRMVQNADISLDNVFVPDDMRLAKADSFATSTNAALESSRITVAWVGCGIAVGAYEAALKYALQRKQFGKPIAKFQITQEKLSRMLSYCELMLSNLALMCEGFDQGKVSIGKIGRAKAVNTKLAREVCQLAREICGGNGIILENHVMKSLMDIEAVYTYEGTYEVNSLVSGREITGGLAAFK